VAHGQLALGLADLHFDDVAKRELEMSATVHPALAHDPTFLELRREIDRRGSPPGDVVEF
jgi:hypothetical protein